MSLSDLATHLYLKHPRDIAHRQRHTPAHGTRSIPQMQWAWSDGPFGSFGRLSGFRRALLALATCATLVGRHPSGIAAMFAQAGVVHGLALHVTFAWDGETGSGRES